MKFTRVFCSDEFACYSEIRIFVTRIFDGAGVNCTRIWRHSTSERLEVTLPEVSDTRCTRVCVRSIVTASLHIFGHYSSLRFHLLRRYVTFIKRIILKTSSQCQFLFCKSNENTNLMQHCAGFISAGSLYMFRAQAPIIRSI